MDSRKQFITTILSEFPEDRLTYQKSVPTFHPESAKEAARLFQLANKNNQGLFITGFGNNIAPEGPAYDKIIAIKTDRLNNIIKIKADDFYVTVGSGYPLRELNKILAPENLWLPHGSLPYVGSVGGALAGGLSCSFDETDFPLKKYFIQAEIVTPEGEIINPGSNCFKSVSGYDVVRIFFNSWGMLGFIVNATLRVMPLTGADDYKTLAQKKLDRMAVIGSLDPDNQNTDAVYCQKIKDKLDPNQILPVI